MPKFNIYEPDRGAIDVDTGLPVQTAQRRVSIGWSRDRHVQLGVGWIDPTKTVDDLFGSENSLLLQGGEADEQARVWLSQWCDMDRHTINQVIRELRKARDEAFGKDE